MKPDIKCTTKQMMKVIVREIEIGVLSNIVVEIRGGNIIDMMVIPNPNFDTTRYRKEDNFILIPFDSVSAIKDYIIIDKMKAKA